MKDKIPFEKSCGNVFADLGLENAEELYIRASLGIHVMKLIRKGGYSQKEAAALLEVKQPEISALMRAKFQRFSQERLMTFLNKLNQKITIKVSPRHKGEPYQQVAIASLSRESSCAHQRVV